MNNELNILLILILYVEQINFSGLACCVSKVCDCKAEIANFDLIYTRKFLFRLHTLS